MYIISGPSLFFKIPGSRLYRKFSLMFRNNINNTSINFFCLTTQLQVKSTVDKFLVKYERKKDTLRQNTVLQNMV